MPVYKREQEKAHNEVSILKQDYESTANGSYLQQPPITFDDQNQSKSVMDDEKQVNISHIQKNSQTLE